VLIEVAVIEDQQEFRAVALETLKRVGDAAREVPDIPLFEIVLEGMTVLVGCGHPNPSFDDEAPLVWFVPVHFPYRTRLEPHVNAVERLGDLQFSSSGLPRPSTGLQPVVTIGEGPFQARQRAVVRRRRRKSVPALGLPRGV